MKNLKLNVLGVSSKLGVCLPSTPTHTTNGLPAVLNTTKQDNIF